MGIVNTSTNLVSGVTSGVSKLSDGVQNVTQHIIPTSSDKLDIPELLKVQRNLGASDLHLIAGEKPRVRSANGKIQTVNLPVIPFEDLHVFVKAILEKHQKWDVFLREKEMDVAVDFEDIGRFRLNVYRERNGLGLVFRKLPTVPPSIEQLGLENTILPSLTKLTHGLVLVTGQNDSGKTTTISALIDHINKTMNKHILIIEDPIEIVHTPHSSMISHREVGKHTNTYAESIRHALRQDIDIVVIGEMRDYETISAAIETAEAGYLVLGTLHTSNAVESIQRIISVYSKNKQDFVQHQLSTILKGVVSQKLLSKKDGIGRVMCREVLIPNTAISHLIREGDYSKIRQIMELSQDEGNQTFDQMLLDLFQKDEISFEICMRHAHDKDWMEEHIGADPDGTGI